MYVYVHVLSVSVLCMYMYISVRVLCMCMYKEIHVQIHVYGTLAYVKVGRKAQTNNTHKAMNIHVHVDY